MLKREKKNKQQIKIAFSKRIYPKKAIEEAIEAYSNLVRFVLEDEEKKIFVTGDKINSSSNNDIFNEFANYVLSRSRKWI